MSAAGRTYQIRTYGCQMNAHDSERLAGLLDEAGYRPAADGETPDVVVFNTCAVRENAADRLYGNLGHLYSQKKKGMQIAVGGCLAQMERTRITERAPWVDVVYGTHNMGSLPALLERARVVHPAGLADLDDRLNRAGTTGGQATLDRRGVLTAELPLTGVVAAALRAKDQEPVQPAPVVDLPGETTGAVGHLPRARDRRPLRRPPSALTLEIVHVTPPFEGCLG